jgi:3-hydroxyisobutyrate dehydrogenase-like beta-hydroxyacid dehydrogenase
MPLIGIVSPGQMGAALGAALQAAGADVVTTLEGRSERTARLAADAGLPVLPTVRAVTERADVLLSVTPPGEARANARRLAATARPDAIIADLNAIAPATMQALAGDLEGRRVVDGSISGPPPTTAQNRTTIYLAGTDAAVVAGLPWGDRVKAVVVGERIGSASAVKMCTGSVYKGLTALITQALRTAGANGVLEPVLRDLQRNGLAPAASVVGSAPKAHRFVAEMREVAATQEAAGLTPDLFTAIAGIYAGIARTRLAQGFPEDAAGTAADLSPSEIVARLT